MCSSRATSLTRREPFVAQSRELSGSWAKFAAASPPPSSRPRTEPGARERFVQKMLGTSVASEATGHLVSSSGTRVPVEVSAVALTDGDRGRPGLQGPSRRQHHSPTPASHPPPSRGAPFPGAGLLDEADRCRAPPEHRDGQKPRSEAPESPRRQHPTRSRRRRPAVNHSRLVVSPRSPPARRRRRLGALGCRNPVRHRRQFTAGGGFPNRQRFESFLRE